jgi:gp32 DNA binding protein like
MENTMVDFAKLKAMRGEQSLAALTAELEKITTKKDTKKDERFWTPTVDKAGNGYAVIRFLPAPGNEDVPFVRIFDHGFKGPSGSWYIENSLTTIGKKDPVGEFNSQLWNSGVEADKEQARKQKRRLHFISNIYVVEDHGNPENNGKVFLFKYGKKIFDKLNEVMNPQFPDEKPLNPFDFWEGANFALKIRMVEGYRNYDKSTFMTSSALAKDDKKLEAIHSQEYSLQEFLAPSNFKSYEELKEKFDRVMMAPMEGRTSNAMDQEDSLPPPQNKTRGPSAPPMSEAGDDDDDLEFFKKLAS